MTNDKTAQLDLLTVPTDPSVIRVVCYGAQLECAHEELKANGYVALSVDIKRDKYTIRARKVR